MTTQAKENGKTFISDFCAGFTRGVGMFNMVFHYRREDREVAKEQMLAFASSVAQKAGLNLKVKTMEELLTYLFKVTNGERRQPFVAPNDYVLIYGQTHAGEDLYDLPENLTAEYRKINANKAIDVLKAIGPIAIGIEHDPTGHPYVNSVTDVHIGQYGFRYAKVDGAGLVVCFSQQSSDYVNTNVCDFTEAQAVVEVEKPSPVQSAFALGESYAASSLEGCDAIGIVISITHAELLAKKHFKAWEEKRDIRYGIMTSSFLGQVIGLIDLALTSTVIPAAATTFSLNDTRAWAARSYSEILNWKN